MQTKKQSKTTNPKKNLTSVAYLSTLLALAGQASAFQSARELHATMPAAERSVPRGVSAARSSTVLCHRRDPTLSSSRLHYRDGGDEADASSSRFGWLNTIFPGSHPAHDSEQEFVDEYLEFLDRRYRRLHTQEDEESPSKPFSALNWLKQGSSSRNDVIATEQQQDDALFVLGVAGLASRRLLQRHQLPVEAEHTEGMDNAEDMQVVDAKVSPAGPLRVLVQNVVVPVIQFVYALQRRKGIFVRNQIRQLREIIAVALQKTGSIVAEGPFNAAKSLVEMGGGSKTIAATFATLTTMLIILRPIVKTVMTEAPVGP